MLEMLKKFMETKNNLVETPKMEGQELTKKLVAEPDLLAIKSQSLESLQVQNSMVESALKETSEVKGRPLTEAERADIKEKTNMSDKTLDKCYIRDDGQLCLKCTNESYAGKVHEQTGIPYERKIVDINGVKIEVVVPKFNSLLDVQLPADVILAKDSVHFKLCNEALKDAVANDPELRAKFNERQLQLIEKGHNPSGYTWHHDAELGKIQLVSSKEHNVASGGAAHTGGKAIWGGGQENR